MVLRKISIFAAAILTLTVAFRSAVGASSYIVADAQTGWVLQAHEPRQKTQIGSLTKVATAMVILDWAEHKGGNLTQMAVIPPEAFVGTGENSIGFEPGDAVELRTLLYAALVQSDNIAAITLAHYVGSTLETPAPVASRTKVSPVDVFVGQMNALAKQLKMERTRFVNPHGQDHKVRPLPYSTVEDLARLTRYAMSKASFRFYVSQKERQISFYRGHRKLNYLLRNTNELLGVQGIDGVKTGRTMRAGDCLILSSVRDSEVIRHGENSATVFPRRIIVVLLGSTNRFGEGAELVQRGWQLYDQWAAAGRLVDPNKVL